MTAGRISKRAARLTALALFLTISFLLAALPLHHAGHLCSGAGCPVCLSISKWQRDGSAPLPPLQTEAAALAAAALCTILPPRRLFSPRTRTSRAGAMRN